MGKGRRLRAGFSGLWITPLLILQLLTASLTTVQAAGSSDYSFASGSFRQVWEYYDLPVVARQATRSLTWGVQGFAFQYEPYAESIDHQRLVQYFDKGRMEITFPANDRSDPFYVTSGLLVRDMVAGIVQTGANQFTNLASPDISIAGDPINIGPTYLSFRQVATLNQNNRANDRTGAVVAETITRSGWVGESTELSRTQPVKYAHYVAGTGHNIAGVFWDYMQQNGPVYQNGAYSRADVYGDTLAVFGLPITEAYWSKVIVAGVPQDVLIQLFERRVLTYNPSNPDGFKTEMGNVGLHYYNWRYGGQSYVAPWVNASITNKSECASIRLKLTGQDYLTIDIPAYKSVSYKLGPGTYDYEATGCEATPNKGNFSVSAGQSYEIIFGLKKEIIRL